MKYRKLVAASLITVFSLAGGVSVNASSEANSTDTNGFLEFSTGSGTTVPKPVDPLLPENEIQTDKTPTDGDYSIVYTSDFQFGEHTLGNGDATFLAENPTVTYLDGTTKEVPNFVEILDRSGSKNGWRLFANLTSPLTNEDGTTIDNMTISLSNINVNSTGGFDNSVITIPTNVTLQGNTQESVMVAEDASGKTAGFWIITFGNSVSQGETSVSMFIPNTQSIEAGTYNTNVTWSFEAAL